MFLADQYLYLKILINIYSVFSFQGTEQKFCSAVLHKISVEAPLRGASGISPRLTASAIRDQELTFLLSHRLCDYK